MKQTIRMGLAALAFGLMACGEVDESDLGGQVVGLIRDRDSGEQAPAQLSVTQEQLLSTRGQFLRVNIRELERWDTMVQAGENGARTTWIDSARISLTLEEGIVVATRGLRRDLMGAETRATAQAIRAGGGTAVRTHDFLDDQDQIVTMVLNCEIASQGADAITRLGETINATRYEEQCVSDDLTLTNLYWVNNTRGIVRSLQAVSPDAGYVQVDVF